MIASSALRTEIESGLLAATLAPFVAVGNDSKIAELLNAKTQTALQPIPIFEYAMWAAKTGVRRKLKAGLAHENASIADICDIALEVMSNPHATSLDLTDAGSMALMESLMMAGIVTSGERAALVAFCTRPASRIEVVFGIGAVATAEQCGSAR